MKKKIFVWCSDVDKFTGEGILANKFINDLKKFNPKLKLVIKSLTPKKTLLLRRIFGKIADRLIVPLWIDSIMAYILVQKK